MKIVSPLLLAAIFLAATSAAAEPVETEIDGVTAEVAELRTSGGVTRLAVRFINSGTKKAESSHYSVGKIVLVDAKSKKKHLPIKDASGYFIGGPIGDTTLDGGRIYVVLEAGQQGVAWAYFDALPAGTVVSVEVPQMFPFEDVVVTEGPGTLLSAGSAKSSPVGAVATLASSQARRPGVSSAAQAGRRTGGQGRPAQPLLHVQGRLPVRPGRQTQVSPAEGQRRLVAGLAAQR